VGEVKADGTGRHAPHRRAQIIVPRDRIPRADDSEGGIEHAMLVHEELDPDPAVALAQGSYRHATVYLMIAADGQHWTTGSSQSLAKLGQHRQRLGRANHVAGEDHQRRGPRVHGGNDALL
jgi:hypothetical protein